MGRQHGADLWQATRNKRYSSIDSSRKKNVTFSTLKDWRNGITGRIQFSTKVELIDEEGQSDTRHNCNNDTDAAESMFPIPPLNAKISEYADGTRNNDSVDPSLQKLVHLVHNNQRKERQRRKMILCVEVEKCIDLKSSTVSLAKLSHLKNAALNPFVLLKLNGKEIGRTPVLKNTKNPIWFDELFQFPICSDCGILSFEIWDIVPTVGIIQAAGGFIGKCTIDVRTLTANASMGEGTFQEHNLELKRWRNVENLTISDTSCHCPHPSPEPTSPESGNSMQERSLSTKRNTVHISRPTGITSSFRIKRLNSVIIEKPSDDSPASNKFRIENPYPFRRRDVREYRQSDEEEPFFKSTSFKALSLIMVYMSVGVVGFSFVFERWSLRDSIYFSVVTFTTVGYG